MTNHMLPSHLLEQRRYCLSCLVFGVRDHDIGKKKKSALSLLWLLRNQSVSPEGGRVPDPHLTVV